MHFIEKNAEQKRLDLDKKLAMLEEQENNQLHSWNNLKEVDQVTYDLMIKEFQKIKKELGNVKSNDN